MIAAVIALAALALLLGGSSVAAMIKVFGAADKIETAGHHEADARIAQVSMEAELERRNFEIEKLTTALKAVEARASALEEIVADELNDSHANDDLGRADYRSRLLRLARSWSGATANGVPAEPGTGVSANTATAAPDADLSSPSGVSGV